MRADVGLLQFTREYRDAGVSGTRDLDDRGGLGEPIHHIRSNGVRLVVVERADRLARNLLVSEVILGQFRDLGVRVIAADKRDGPERGR